MDLSNEYIRKQLAERISKDIEAASKKELAQEPRKHLGASEIGHDCLRYTWLNFRWCKFQDFSGRMLRLFNRGHLEEPRFIRWLRAAGFTVWEYEEGTTNQIRVLGYRGHFGGSLDSVLALPTAYGFDKIFWLGEFKTHSEKKFTDLAGTLINSNADLPRVNGKGVKKAQPKHFRQMCVYAHYYKLKYGLYCAVNKNTDELYFEIVEIDPKEAEDQTRKSEEVIRSQEPPAKIAQTKTFITCKYCHMSGICFDGEIPQKNCRSCRLAVAAENKEWFCQLHKQNIPEHIIPTGCSNWSRII